MGNTEAKYIYKSLAKKKNEKSLLSNMSIIRRGVFSFTIGGERPRRGEVIGEEYLINFFLSRKSPNTISCHILSTQHKREQLTLHQINIFLRLEIIINDFKEREETFLDYKNRTFQSPNYHIFPKGLTQAMAFFNEKHGLTRLQFLNTKTGFFPF